jgi:hypothetical protein
MYHRLLSLSKKPILTNLTPLEAIMGVIKETFWQYLFFLDRLSCRLALHAYFIESSLGEK